MTQIFETWYVNSVGLLVSLMVSCSKGGSDLTLRPREVYITNIETSDTTCSVNETVFSFNIDNMGESFGCLRNAPTLTSQWW